MRRAATLRVAAGPLAAAALCLGACGSRTLAPRLSHATRERQSSVAQAQQTHEYPSPPPHQRAGRWGGSPAAAVRAFASRYINWDAGTVSGDMRALAADSIGQARAATQLAAAQTAGDYELRRGGIANTGTVEAVAPLAGEPNRYVVVTRELTTATATTAYQGLQPAWHVAIATVTQVAPGRWVVSAWQPES